MVQRVKRINHHLRRQRDADLTPVIEQNNRQPRMASPQLVEQFGQLRLGETPVGMAGKILITTAFPLSDARYCATSCIIGPGTARS